MKKSSLILALALALSAGSALAQPSGDPADRGDGPPGDGPRGGKQQPHPDALIIKALDANGDGVIDASEIANAAAALKTLDKNGDGQLTPDEYLPPRPGGTNSPPPGGNGHKPPRPPLIAALDVNGDGIIDANEIANAPAELLTLDKNGDGKLTPREYRPHRPPPDGGPDGGPGGGPPGDGNGPPKEPPQQ